jgi:hypothetical protein
MRHYRISTVVARLANRTHRELRSHHRSTSRISLATASVPPSRARLPLSLVTSPLPPQSTASRPPVIPSAFAHLAGEDHPLRSLPPPSLPHTSTPNLLPNPNLPLLLILTGFPLPQWKASSARVGLRGRFVCVIRIEEGPRERRSKVPVSLLGALSCLWLICILLFSYRNLCCWFFLDYLDLKPVIAHSTLLVRNRLFSLAAPISLAREQSRRFSACSLGFVLRSNKIIWIKAHLVSLFWVYGWKFGLVFPWLKNP